MKKLVTELSSDESRARSGSNGAGISLVDEGAEGRVAGIAVDMVRERMEKTKKADVDVDDGGLRVCETARPSPFWLINLEPS